MKLRLITLLLSTQFFLLSCNQQKPAGDQKNTSNEDFKSSIVELEKKIISIHDEIMPKMGELMNLKEQLNIKSDSIKNTNPKADIFSYQNAMNEIDSARENMMVWMRNFKKVDMNDLSQESINYYNQQKKSIEEVKNNTLEVINNCNELLNSESTK